MNHTDYAETYTLTADSEDYSSIPAPLPVPTMAHVSWIVDHGYLIDTDDTFRDGGKPTIHCEDASNNPDRFVGQSWRHICQLIRDFELCACGSHEPDDSIEDPFSA